MGSKLLWLILLLLLQVFAVRAVSYDKQETAAQGLETISKIPLDVSGWKGTDHPLDQKVYDILETQSIIHRSYRNNKGQEVFLSIVYYAETKVDFHAPEGCLGGMGVKTTKSPAEITLKPSGKAQNEILGVNQLIQVGDNGKNTLIYYFFKSGPFIGRSYLGLRLNLVLNKFRNSQKSGSLIRVSTTINQADEHTKEATLLTDFINGLYPYLLKCL